MGGGAAVAAIAAARARQVREVLDAYRLAGATAREHAKAPGALGVGDHDRIINELVSAGVLVDTAGGALFLSERGYIDYRDRSNTRRKTAVVLVLLLAAILLGLGVFMSTRASG